MPRPFPNETCGQKSSCPFCRALKDDETFFSSRHFAAITNIAPVVPGHSLLVPRRHVARLTELAPEELAELAPAAHHVGELLRDAFGSTGVNWSIQDGVDAGQTVFHLHLHILPRYEGDLPDPGDWYPHVMRWEDRLLDSARRPRISKQTRCEITRRLRDVADDRPFEN